MALDSRKVTLAPFNYVDKFTLSGGSYTAAKPLALAQTRDLGEFARTTDATTGSTQLLMTFDKRRTIGFVGIYVHNLSTDATVRVYVRDAADATVYDSGAFPAWPPVLGLHQVAWQDPNWWSRQPSEEDRAQYKAFAWHAFEPVATAYSVLLEIQDPNNSDGYVEFARLIVSDLWQPTWNMEWDNAWGYDPTTKVEAGDQPGVEFFQEGPNRRTFTFELGGLDVQEAFDQIARMQNVLGISGEIVVAHELADTPQRYSRTMVARLTQLDPIRHPNTVFHRTGMALLELI